jgi:hypothetical protein
VLKVYFRRVRLVDDAEGAKRYCVMALNQLDAEMFLQYHFADDLPRVVLLRRATAEEASSLNLVREGEVKLLPWLERLEFSSVAQRAEIEAALY